MVRVGDVFVLSARWRARRQAKRAWVALPAEDVEEAVDWVRLCDDGADEGSSAAASADAKVNVKGPSQEGLPIDGGVEVAAVEAVQRSLSERHWG